MPREDHLLEAHGLCTFYGTSQALFDIDLSVPSRGLVAVLGRNGAGKTTLLKTLVGDLAPTRGNVKFDGTDATHLPTEQRIRRGMGYVPPEQGVFARLTVKDNLLVGAIRRGDGSMCLEEVLQLFPCLERRLSQQAGTLSGGERKMLAISRALLARPRLLILDEPTEGVWHSVVQEIAERLEQLARDVAVLVVEQHIELALRISRHVYVMDRGHVTLEGPSDQIRDNVELTRLLAP